MTRVRSHGAERERDRRGASARCAREEWIVDLSTLASRLVSDVDARARSNANATTMDRGVVGVRGDDVEALRR